MAQATIDLGLNTASFTAGLNEAERKSQSFEGRVAGLFKRSPLQRAERAFSEFAVNLSTGNVAQGVAGFAAKLSGLGLAAGVGIGAAVGFFLKLKGQLDATAKSLAAVNAELAKPLEIQSQLGVEGITAQITALDKALTDLAEKRKSLASRIQAAGVRGAPETFDEMAFFRGERQPPTIRTTEEETAQERGQKRIHALRLADVEAEKSLVNIHALSTQFSEKEAALEKNRIEAEQKRAALRLKFGADPREAKNLHDELLNISRDEKLSADEIERKAALKQKELDIDKDIAALALRGVSTEDQKVSKLERELALIQEQLSGAEKLTTENRKQLETSEAKTQAELAAARAAASGRPVLSNRDIHERAKLSLADIAANATQGTRLPFNLADEQLFSEQAKALGPAAMARQALRSEEFARQAALRGDLGTAETLFGMSDKLRAGIPGLKSAEQPVSMVDALKEYGKGPEIVTKLEELKSKMDAYWGN